MKLGRRTAALVGALAAATVTMSACSQEKELPSADLSAAKSDQAFSLFLGDDLAEIDYAQLKLRNECLVKAGYPQYAGSLLAAPHNPFQHLNVTAGSFGPTSEAEARRKGFGKDTAPVPPSIVSSDPNHDVAYKKCTDRAWAALSGDTKRVYYAYFDLGNKLGQPLLPMINERLGESPRRKMLSCLRARNYRAVDEQAFMRNSDPSQFGVRIAVEEAGDGERWQPKAVPGTIEVGPAEPGREYTPSPEESAFAVAWFRCGQESGLVREEMAAAAAVQRELVAKYESSFLELNPQITEAAKHASTLIGKQ